MPAESKDEDVDLFVANRIYPDAEAIFKTQLEPVTEISGDCLIVLDTNALLVPYTIGRKTLDEIENTYKSLVEENRLIIPGQVAREFARNRASKIAELFQQLSRKRDGIRALKRGRYPLLEALDDYSDAIKLEGKIDELIKTYRDTLGKVLEHVRGWTWNDPVSLLYNRLFGDSVVFDPEINEKEIQADLTWRKDNGIPPGYKDSGKSDRGVGDLLVWRTILGVGQDRSKHLIFVSGDEKADWYHKSEGQALYPRFELVDEYRRHSRGKSFYIVPFSHFLTIFGASESVVEEVRAKEQQDVGPEPSRPAVPFLSLNRSAEEAVYRWLLAHHPHRRLIRDFPVEPEEGGVSFRLDFVILDDEQRRHAYEVKYVTARSVRHLFRRLRDLRRSASYALSRQLVESYTAVLVAEDPETCEAMVHAIENTMGSFDDVRLVGGFVSSEGIFMEAYASFL